MDEDTLPEPSPADPVVIGWADQMEQDPAWKEADKETRARYIRSFAIKSRADIPDPVQHAALVQELWGRSDPRGNIHKAAAWTGNAVKEVAASAAVGAVPFIMAGSDAVGASDTGSGERLKAGLRNLWDGTQQRLKSFAPNDYQENRDKGLDFLKRAIDTRQYPSGVEGWLSGEVPLDKLDEPSRAFASSVTNALAVAAVKADHGDKATEKELNAYRNSGRSLLGTLPEAGESARSYLADYVATGDPSSWDAFTDRAKETDAAWKSRLATDVTDQHIKQVAGKDPGFLDGLAMRGLEMQKSPIDLATAVLPLLRGGKALAVARAGAAGQHVLLHALKDVAKEAASEGLTTFLQEPNASNAKVLEDAAVGAVGQGAMTAGSAGGGHVLRRLAGVGPVPVAEGQPPAFEPGPPEGAEPATAAAPLISAPPPASAAPESPAAEPALVPPPTAPGPQGLEDVAARAGTVDNGPDAGLFPIDDEDAIPETAEQAAADSLDPSTITTAPTPQDPYGTVTETKDTLLEQRARVAAGTEPAMTLPGVKLENLPAEFAPQPGDGLAAMDSPAGVAILPEADVPVFTQAAKEGRLGEALGYGVPDRPAQPTGAIVLRNAEGVEVKAAEVDASTRQTVLDALHDRAQPGDTVAEESLPEVTARRTGMLAPLLEATPERARPETPLTQLPQGARSEDYLPNELLPKYFAPGRLVPGYSGVDRVVAFTPGDEHAPWWSATVREQVRNADGSYQDMPGARDRRHSTHPTYGQAARSGLTFPDAQNASVVRRRGQIISAQPGQRTRLPRENARRNIAAGWRQIAQEVTPEFGWTDSPNLDDIAAAVSKPDSPVTIQERVPGRDLGVQITTRSGPLTITQDGPPGSFSIYSASMRGSQTAGTRSAGSQAYLAAFLWARNNNKRIISHGLTEINRTRRTSNMLSMALRRLAVGDTDFTNHSEPAPEQGLRWRGTPEDKLVDMLLREHDHVAANVPELQDLSYDRRRRTFTFRGNPIGTEGIAGFRRNAVGSASIRRAVITRGLLDHPFRPSRSRSGGGAGAGETGARRRLPVALRGLLYSQPVNPSAEGLRQGGKPLSGSITNPAKVAGEAVTALNAAVPGIVSEQVHFAEDPAALLASRYAEPGYFSAEELRQMQGAEGFHDPRTGRTIVFTGNVIRRPGESPRSAVARVVLHERIGHDGMNRLLETNPEFAARWDRLAAQIPAEELDAIASREGYEHLATDRAQLALEWLAQRTDAIESARLAGAVQGWTGLPRQMWEALKSWLAKAYAGFARQPVMAHEVRELAAAARRAALSGTGIPTNGEALQFSLGGSGVFHADDAPQWQWLRRRLNIQPGQPFRVNHLGWRALLTGSPLPRAMVNTVEATNQARRAADQAAAQIGRDLQTAVNAVVGRTGLPVATVHARVNDMMNGLPGAAPAVHSLDPVLHERARRARNYLDDLSTAIANTLPIGDLRNTILGNLGSWMRRSYAAFDPASGWNYDRLSAAALSGQPLNGVDAARIMRDARAFLQAQSPQATPAEIEADMRDLMDRDAVGNAFAGTSAVRKNISSLIARADIPAPLRALMGEETNALHRFTTSAAFQTQFLRRHEGQQALRTIGLTNGLFAVSRGGVNVEQIPGAAGGTSQRWSPLAGLWTTPQLANALRQTDGGVMAGTDAAGFFARALNWAGHEAKLNRVALSPDSWMVNLFGNVTAVINSGDVFYGNVSRRIGQALSLLRAGKARPGDVFSATAEALADANRAMTARLTASGVLGESFNLRDLQATIPRQLLQWVADDTRRQRVLGGIKGALVGQASLRGLGLTGRLAGAAAGATAGSIAGYSRILGWQNQLAAVVMTAPDALGRLTGFMTNLEAAHASGLTGNDAFQWASERTRNTFPDYGRMPAVMKQLSRFGVMGSFIAFQYEVYRNFAWNARYAVQEIRSRNPALQRRGAARLLGVGSIGTLAVGGLGALVGALTGAAAGDDDRNKKWQKWFAAPWEKDAPLAFSRYDGKGVSYFNTSYLLPQATMGSLINAARKGENPADSAARVVGALWEQFVGGSVNLDPLVTAYANVDRSGRPITNKDGLPGILERMDAAGQTILEPGYAQKLERITYALREATKNGRTFSLEEEAKRLMGVRAYSRSWPELVKRRYQAFNHEHDALMAEGNKTLGLNLPGARAKALTDTNAGLADLRARMADFEADAQTLGIPPGTLQAARKETRPPKPRPVRINPANPNRLQSVK